MQRKMLTIPSVLSLQPVCELRFCFIRAARIANVAGYVFEIASQCWVCFQIIWLHIVSLNHLLDFRFRATSAADKKLCVNLYTCLLSYVTKTTLLDFAKKNFYVARNFHDLLQCGIHEDFHFLIVNYQLHILTFIWNRAENEFTQHCEIVNIKRRKLASLYRVAAMLSTDACVGVAKHAAAATSCYGIASQRPHHCSFFANKVGNINRAGKSGLPGNRILYAEYDMQCKSMNNMLICQCCRTDWLLVLTVMHVHKLLSAAANL